MAVTAQKSAEVQDYEATPVKNIPVHKWSGRVRFRYFKHTQSGAGDANSTADLVVLPQGNVRIFPALSGLKRSAFGAGRVLDVGVTAHKKHAGTAVAAVVDSILDGLDVSGAGYALMGTGTNAKPESILVENHDGTARVQAKVLVDTIPDGATLEGWIAYVID